LDDVAWKSLESQRRGIADAKHRIHTPNYGLQQGDITE
jgi:hypothetical protein